MAFAVGATDVVDGAVGVNCSALPGDTSPLGPTVVQCFASDQSGNPSTGGFTILGAGHHRPGDCGCPGRANARRTSPAGAAVTYAQPTATDIVDGAVAVVCAPASGSTFSIGTTTVTCDAHDAGGNTARETFVITVLDNRGPVFGPTPSPMAYATSTSGAVVTYVPPTAMDDVDGPRPLTCTPSSGSRFAPGSTTVKCTASDTGGNVSEATFVVRVTYQAPTDGSFFLFPIRANGSSIFRIGRPVPARFKLTGASAGITNLVAKFAVTKISNVVQGTVEDTSDETVDDTDFVFKYRALLKRTPTAWRTSNQTTGTYLLSADLGDGVQHTIRVSLR